VSLTCGQEEVGGTTVLHSEVQFHDSILAILLALSSILVYGKPMCGVENPEAPHGRMLPEAVREKLRAGHYSRRTEEAYPGRCSILNAEL